MQKKDKKPLTVNIIGPAGSGKGTQAALLSKAFKLKHFVMGAALRAEIRKETSLGKRIKKTVEAGKLVPMNAVKPLLTDFLQKIKEGQGIIIDGFPRMLAQKRMYDKTIKEFGREPIIIYLNIKPKTSLARLSIRKICRGCGDRPISRSFTEKRCRHCGGRVVQRLDDQPEIIKQRLKVDRQFQLPVKRAYVRASKLNLINAEQTVRKVQRDIRKVLAKKGYAS